MRCSSDDKAELDANPALEIDYIVAPPRMAYYMEYSTKIYNVYLKYVAPEDIFPYSIDEVFIDVTDYLQTYRMTARELAMTMIQDVLKTTGITATAGIGTNMYLCKIAIIHHLAVFVSRLWQIHIFGEGNTRTTAVFFIKYLRTLGFSATNDIFAENAWYFRNALVRANYTNLQKGVHETTEYLEMFLRNLFLNEKNELHNRSLHISGLLNNRKVDIGSKKVDIQDKKVDIESVLSEKGRDFSIKTAVHIRRMFEKFGHDEVFGRSAVTDLLKLKNSSASKLLSNLVQADIIEPVSGYGKGK